MNRLITSLRIYALCIDHGRASEFTRFHTASTLSRQSDAWKTLVQHKGDRHAAVRSYSAPESSDRSTGIIAASSCQQIAQLLHRQVWVTSMKHSVAVRTDEG